MSAAKQENYNPYAGPEGILLNAKLAERAMGSDRYRRMAASYYEAVFAQSMFDAQVSGGREALEDADSAGILDRLATKLLPESHAVSPHILDDQNGWIYAVDVLTWGGEGQAAPSTDPQEGVYIASPISGDIIVGMSLGGDQWQPVARYALNEGKEAWDAYSRQLSNPKAPTLEEKVRFAIGTVDNAIQQRGQSSSGNVFSRLFRR